MCQLHLIGGDSVRHCVEKDSEAWSDSTGKCSRSVSDVCHGRERGDSWHLGQLSVTPVLTPHKIEGIQL